MYHCARYTCIAYFSPFFLQHCHQFMSLYDAFNNILIWLNLMYCSFPDNRSPGAERWSGDQFAISRAFLWSLQLQFDIMDRPLPSPLFHKNSNTSQINRCIQLNFNRIFFRPKIKILKINSKKRKKWERNSCNCEIMK